MSSGKGSQFERDICRVLSLWWTDGKDRDVFWRNRTRTTAVTPDARHQLGDITSVKSEGIPFTSLFNVELKRGYTRKGKVLEVLGLLDSRNRLLLDFWDQSFTDAQLSFREPLLIFKRDFHRPVLVRRMFFDSYTWREVELAQGSYRGDRLEVSVRGYILELVDMEYFLRWLRPETIRGVFNRMKGKHGEAGKEG